MRPKRLESSPPGRYLIRGHRKKCICHDYHAGHWKSDLDRLFDQFQGEQIPVMLSVETAEMLRYKRKHMIPFPFR